MARFFTSEVTNRIDRKGRVSVPALFRSVLEVLGSSSSIYVSRSPRAPAFDCHTESWMDEQLAELKRLRAYSDRREYLEETVFSDADPISIDPDGRIVMPAKVTAGLELTEEVAFVGRADYFQLWHPATRKEHRARWDAKVKAEGEPPPEGAS